MIDIMIAFWIFVFAIFFIGGIMANSRWLSAIAGLWLLIFSILIIVTGVQVQAGTVTVSTNVSSNVTIVYDEMVVPYTTYSVIWGVFLILASLYIFFNALLTEK